MTKVDDGKKKKSLWYSVTHQEELDKEGYLKLIRSVSIFVAAALIVSALVFVVIAFAGGISKVVHVILSADIYVYLLAIISVFAGYMLRYVKWAYYIKRLGLKVSTWKNLAVYLSLYSMDITPGKFGRVLAAYTLNRITKIKFMNIVPIVTMDIFSDFLGTAVVALGAALYFHQYVIYIIAIDIVLLLPFAFILNKWLFNRFKLLLGKYNFIEKFTIYGEEYYASQSVLNSPKVYAVSIIFTIPASVLNAMALYFTIAALGFHITAAASMFTFASTQLFGMVSAVPGNIGVTDGTLTAILSSSLKLPADISSAATILVRIATMWFGVALGSVFLFYTLRFWNMYHKKSVALGTSRRAPTGQAKRKGGNRNKTSKSK